MFAHIDAIIWDLDNTITDSREGHFHTWDITLKKYNIPHDRNFFEAHYGMSNKEIFEGPLSTYVKDIDYRIISEEKENLFRALIFNDALKILPGVETWMRYAQEKKIVQSVASSGPMQNIVAQIHATGLGGYFRTMATGATLPKGKPHPQIFLNAAAGLGIHSSKCLVIEDTIHGIEAALHANMYCILVRKISSTEHKEIQSLATQYATQEQQYICVDSLEDIAPQKILVSL